MSIRIYGEIVGMFATPQVAQGIPFDYSDGNYPGGPFINYAVTDEAKARYVVERIEAGDVAQFTYIALPNDHTVGTRAGQPTPESMVADNDYAVGLLVEGLARSDLWEKSVVFILQDDPQGCEDHVDVHRSPLVVASPGQTRPRLSRPWLLRVGIRNHRTDPRRPAHGARRHHRPPLGFTPAVTIPPRCLTASNPGGHQRGAVTWQSAV